MCRRVALLAGDGRVLFQERVSSLAMIELLERRFPVNEREILAVVLEVAAHAIPAGGILHAQKRVVALMRGQAVRDFLVAIEALERRGAGAELVAGIALGRAVEGLVGLGEGTGRNLGAGAGRAEQQSAEHQYRGEDLWARDSPSRGALRVSNEKRHQPPPTNRTWRFHRCRLEIKLARTLIRQPNQPTSCAIQGKLAGRTGKG